MKNETEPLIELLYQEFPNKDPQEIERIVKTVRKWLEQEIQRIQHDKKILKEQHHVDIDLNPLKDGTIIELMCLIRDLKKQVSKEQGENEG